MFKSTYTTTTLDHHLPPWSTASLHHNPQLPHRSSQQAQQFDPKLEKQKRIKDK